jgi:hypothetical protein
MSDGSSPQSPAVQQWLERYLTRHGAVAGTVHVVADDVLIRAAAVNIPEPVMAATAAIPRGRGMAGLAWERAAPVQTCNLATDDSGSVRAGARSVPARAAVALPVFGVGGEVAAVVGIAFADERELPGAEIDRLADAARNVPLP